jgi:P27 family predicted phage terminase small subunit
MVGRKPIPTTLKLLRGNPGRRPLPENEPQVPAGIPECPKFLKGKAKAEWDRVVPLLNDNGMLTEIDGTALAGYCICFAMLAEASEKIDKTGRLIKSSRGDPIINPFQKLLDGAIDRTLKFQVEFGMTPSSRSRVKAAPKKGKKAEGEDYFGWAEKNRA